MGEVPQPLVFFVAYRFDPAQIACAGSAPPCVVEMYETFPGIVAGRHAEALARDMVSALLSIC
jgi:hypothetical protein